MKNLLRVLFVLSLVSLMAGSLACGPTRGSGGGRNNGANNGGNNGANNGGTTPGNVWGRAADDGGGDTGAGGFGFGQGTIDGANNGGDEQPGTVEASDCTAACDLIGQCFASEIDSSDLATCPSACGQEALPSEVACILDSATCEDIVTRCVDVEAGTSKGNPADGESCDSACSAIASCFPEVEGELTDCAQGCRAEATQAEVDCVLSSSCGDVLPHCFGVDGFDVPTNNGTNNGGNNGTVTGDCVEACDHVITCYADLVGASEAEAGRAECETGCSQEASAADIQCILNASCEEISSGACDTGSGTNNGSTNNGSTNNGTISPSFECQSVCPFLALECGAFSSEEDCYATCDSWGSIDPGCVFEASCGAWESCL